MKDWRKLEPDRYRLMNKNFTPGRGGHRIEMVVIHHNAGVLSIDGIWDVWQDRPASAHYQVQSDGQIGQLVYDKDTAHHAANFNINQRSIGIEVSNSAGPAQDWPITDTAIREAARLTAAVCWFYKLGRPNAGTNVRFHREFTTTSCPYHLAPGGKYHQALMSEARRFYDELARGVIPAVGVSRKTNVLEYSRQWVKQDTFYNCGPASTQTIILSSTGELVDEARLGRALGTTTRGTDYIGQFPGVLNYYLKGADYRHRDMPNDPPTAAQKTQLWADLTSSINAGYGVVANIVAPPSNYPRAVAPSTISPAYNGGTVYHYIALMGWSDEDGVKKVWVADSGFTPYGYWISFDQLATLIPPKGYAYATAQPKEKPVAETILGGVSAAALNDAKTAAQAAARDAADTREQLRGRGDAGWEQLGQNQNGQNLTLVDAVAALRHDVAELSRKIDQIGAK